MNISALTENGFALHPAVLDPETVHRLRERLGEVPGAGRRGMLAQPEVVALAREESLLALVRPHLPGPPVPVRAIFFDKTPDANWLVPWHQDVTIAVRQKVEQPGFGPWSVKDGVTHVQPPVEILEAMLTLRLHLDDADETNGALKVLPGTHRHGRLDEADIRRWRNSCEEYLCHAPAGSALLMRPLLLHASGRSLTDRRRRIVHIEYAGVPLPLGLAWLEAT